LFRIAQLILLIILGAPTHAAPGDSAAWLKLLHYRANRFSLGYQSEVDHRDFFLAPQGKFDPAAEWEATHSGLLKNPQLGCRFPARAILIMKQDPKVSVRFDQCEDYWRWRQEITPSTVSLVYVAQYANNPASIFGHMFLRLDKIPPLMAMTVSYFASIPETDNLFKYSWKGLTGGYTGNFVLDRYYAHVNRYTSIENRDLWENRLKLAPDQIELLMAHIWELLNMGEMNYYFLTENCAYQMLALIETVVPELDLHRRRIGLYATPMDVLKNLGDSGLIQEQTFRPSLHRRLTAQVKSLDQKGRSDFKNIIHQKQSIEKSTDTFVADAVLTYHSYARNDEALSEALKKRALLPPSKRVALDFNDEGLRPDLSHESYLLGGAVLTHEDETEYELTLRPAIHGNLDHDVGNTPFSHIEILSMKARVHESGKHLRLHDLTFLHMQSYRPWSVAERPLSWRARVALDENEAGVCPTCRRIDVSIAAGSSFQTASANVNFYQLLSGHLQHAESQMVGAPGLILGTMIQLKHRYRILFEAESRYNLVRPGNERWGHLFVAEQSTSITRNIGVRFFWRQFTWDALPGREATEYGAGIQGHF
jgi:hypothetical protein